MVFLYQKLLNKKVVVKVGLSIDSQWNTWIISFSVRHAQHKYLLAAHQVVQDSSTKNLNDSFLSDRQQSAESESNQQHDQSAQNDEEETEQPQQEDEETRGEEEDENHDSEQEDEEPMRRETNDENEVGDTDEEQ
jgi:hypothetical protein